MLEGAPGRFLRPLPGHERAWGVDAKDEAAAEHANDEPPLGSAPCAALLRIQGEVGGVEWAGSLGKCRCWSQLTLSVKANVLVLALPHGAKRLYTLSHSLLQTAAGAI